MNASATERTGALAFSSKEYSTYETIIRNTFTREFG